MSNLVRLVILGEEFTLRSEHDPQYLREIAAFVDRKIDDISQRTNIVDTNKLILLTAINIADDLFRLKFSHDEFQGEVDSRLESLLKLLDKTI